MAMSNLVCLWMYAPKRQTDAICRQVSVFISVDALTGEHKVHFLTILVEIHFSISVVKKQSTKRLPRRNMMFIGILATLRLLSVVSAVSNDNVQNSTPEISLTPTEKASPSTLCLAEHPGVSRFFNQNRFHEIFPNAIELYTFNGLVNAANQYLEFANTGNETNDKRELAAFLAQMAHESDNFKAAEEYGHENYTVWQYCDNTTYPCVPGRRYHGRGPIQLSWNYNYYNAGNALGIDLLTNPDTVATNTTVAWMTALWYWMTPQAGRVIHDVVSGINGFAISTDIINGGLECGPNAPNKRSELQRMSYFTQMCDVLGVQPLGNISCNE
ncbi:putative glycoside hydrolase, family 19, Lysozyme-like domain superfamily [Plasmopara halstedii]